MRVDPRLAAQDQTQRVVVPPVRGAILDDTGQPLVDYLGDEYDGDRLDALDWLADRTERAFIEPPPADTSARSITTCGTRLIGRAGTCPRSSAGSTRPWPAR